MALKTRIASFLLSKSFRHKELSFPRKLWTFFSLYSSFSNLPWVALAHAEEQLFKYGITSALIKSFSVWGVKDDAMAFILEYLNNIF